MPRLNEHPKLHAALLALVGFAVMSSCAPPESKSSSKEVTKIRFQISKKKPAASGIAVLGLAHASDDLLSDSCSTMARADAKVPEWCGASSATEPHPGIAADATHLFIADEVSLEIHRYERSSGELIDSIPMPELESLIALVIEGSTLHVLDTRAGRVHRYDKSSGLYLGWTRSEID